VNTLYGCYALSAIHPGDSSVVPKRPEIHHRDTASKWAPSSVRSASRHTSSRHRREPIGGQDLIENDRDESLRSTWTKNYPRLSITSVNVIFPHRTDISASFSLDACCPSSRRSMKDDVQRANCRHTHSHSRRYARVHFTSTGRSPNAPCDTTGLRQP
jgi:hypothetical protein